MTKEHCLNYWKKFSRVSKNGWNDIGKMKTSIKVVISREVREVQEGATCFCDKKLSKIDGWTKIFKDFCHIMKNCPILMSVLKQ